MNDVVQRTRQYWFADGLVELSVGSTFLILGLYFYLQSILPSSSPLMFIIQASFVLLLFGIIFLSRYLVKVLKDHMTFPRTGYVSYKRANIKQRILSISVSLIIASLILLMFITTPLSIQWLPAVTGSIVAVMWLISAIRIRLHRFYLQATVSAIMGVALSLLSWEIFFSLAIYYSAMGLILVISGGLTLCRYLRVSPPIETDKQTGQSSSTSR
jgi:hypothetical protein